MNDAQVRLVDAIQANDVERVTELIEQTGIDCNFACNEDGDAPLHLAVRSGKLPLVKVLIEKGKAEVTAQYDRWRAAPINVAARRGHLHIVRLLVEEYNCPVDIQQKDGHTALSLAELYQHTEVIKLLQSLRTGRLTDAITKGDFRKVRELMEQGTDPNCIVNANNDTPLHLAAHNGHLQTVRLLVEHKANPNAINDLGALPIHIAARYETCKHFELICSHAGLVHKDPEQSHYLVALPTCHENGAVLDTTRGQKSVKNAGV